MQLDQDGACNVKNEIERAAELYPPPPPHETFESDNLYIDTYLLHTRYQRMNSIVTKQARELLLLPTARSGTNKKTPAGCVVSRTT